MNAEQQAQVDRCREIAELLDPDGQVFRGEHLLDALGQLGLVLEPSATNVASGAWFELNDAG